MRLARAALALALVSLAGCFEAHELSGDAAAALCTPPGTYLLEGTIVESDCGETGGTFGHELSLPPRVSDFGSECTGTVVEAGTCQWRLEGECLIPDNSRSIEALYEARAGGLDVDLTFVVVGFSGEACRARVLLARPAE